MRLDVLCIGSIRKDPTRFYPGTTYAMVCVVEPCRALAWRGEVRTAAPCRTCSYVSNDLARKQTVICYVLRRCNVACAGPICQGLAYYAVPRVDFTSLLGRKKISPGTAEAAPVNRLRRLARLRRLRCLTGGHLTRLGDLFPLGHRELAERTLAIGPERTDADATAGSVYEIP